MTPYDLSSLAAFQRLVARGVTPTPAQQQEFEALKRNLLPEIADDPSTLADESSRPQLDGSNYNDTLHRMTCDELGAIAKRVGAVVFDAAVAAVLKGR